MKFLKIWQPETGGITAQLVLVATVPALLMFVVVSLTLYITGTDEVANTIRERGELLAAALADTSQYAVISGNRAYLERNIQRLIKTDSSITSIAIFDSRHALFVAVKGSSEGDEKKFERAIATDVLEVDLFDDNTSPHASAPPDLPASFRPGQAIGLVEVSLSPNPLLRQKRRSLVVGGLFVLAAALISAVAGLSLAQRLRAPLGAVMIALRQIRQGDYKLRFAKRHPGELGELQSTIIEMAKGLSLTRNEMEQEVLERTQALQKAVELVSRSDAEKRRLIARTNSLLEEERQRIAMEIHDDLNASLIVVKLKAQHIASLTASVPAETAAAEINRTALSIADTTTDLYTAARKIIKRLRPEVLDTLGLKGAIQEMVRSYDELHPECSFRLRTNEALPDLRGELAITCYRLVQEALSNVVKHAGATRVVVSLNTTSDKTALTIAIEDNGRGFNVAERAVDRFGIVGMRERVSTAGGQIVIDASPGSGTVVSIKLPYYSDDLSAPNTTAPVGLQP